MYWEQIRREVKKIRKTQRWIENQTCFLANRLSELEKRLEAENPKDGTAKDFALATISQQAKNAWIAFGKVSTHSFGEFAKMLGEE